MLVRGGAGSGKSRLGLWALEEAQRLGYRAGFLHDGDLDDWHRWRVHQDTLVVVDYVQRRTGDIGEAIRAAARANPAHKLRFLLLERDAVGTWYSNLGKANEDKYTPGGATAYFWMDLSRMDRPGVVEVFTELLRSDPIAGRDAGSLADQFLTIEPDGRPLFAAFYFEAVAKGEEVDGWSRTDLARWVLTHELDERWRPVGIDAEYGHLATVASALRGVTKEFCDSVPCLAPYLPRWEKDKCNVIGSLGGGYEDAPKPRVPALDPDSIAELYILDRLAGAADLGQGVGQAAETKKVLDCLWGEAGSHETLVELVRHCAQSYAGHEMLAKIQDAPDSVPEAVRESLKIQVAAVAAASGASLQEVVGAAGATLAEAAEALPQGGTMLLAQAYFQEAFDREGTVAGRVALDALRALAAANPDEPEVRLALAQALFNATVGREMTEEGQAALADLRKLAEEHPDEPEVRLALAQALTNAVGHLAEDGPRQGALAELRALAEEHPDEPEVRLALAKALNNAVFKLKTDGPRQAGLAELRTLADAHPDEPKVRLALAQALTNAVLKLGEDGPRQAALADLRKLAEEHPDEPEVRLELAKALTNAVLKLEKDGPRQGALDVLRKLAEEHPDEPEVRLRLAQALNNAVLELEKDGPRQAALDELRKLAQAHPDEPEVRLRLAKALNNAVLKLEKDGPRQDALADLRALAEEHPDEPEVRLGLAMALTNAVFKLGQDGPRQAALAELRALAQAHPDEPEVRLRLAQALCNMAIHRMNSLAGHWGAEPFVAEARALAAGHEGEPDWAPVLAFLAQFPA